MANYSSKQPCKKQKPQYFLSIELYSQIKWQTDKPDSVVDNHSSRCIIANTFKQPTRILGEQPIGYLFGLATRGVYPAMNCCQSCGGLLHHRFTLTQS